MTRAYTLTDPIRLEEFLPELEAAARGRHGPGWSARRIDAFQGVLEGPDELRVHVSVCRPTASVKLRAEYPGDLYRFILGSQPPAVTLAGTGTPAGLVESALVLIGEYLRRVAEGEAEKSRVSKEIAAKVAAAKRVAAASGAEVQYYAAVNTQGPPCRALANADGTFRVEAHSVPEDAAAAILRACSGGGRLVALSADECADIAAMLCDAGRMTDLAARLSPPATEQPSEV